MILNNLAQCAEHREAIRRAGGEIQLQELLTDSDESVRDEARIALDEICCDSDPSCGGETHYDMAHPSLPAAMLQYDPKHPIAKGGFGNVYKAVWGEKVVAFKRAQVNSQSNREKFEHEVAVMEGLCTVGHPNIVGLYAVCKEQGHLGIIMPYLARGSLYQLLHESPQVKLSWPMRIDIAYGVACGVEFMHTNGMLHGDIKSLNVLMGDDDRPKLCDFDSAIIVNGYASSRRRGTLSWMTPELLRRDYVYNKYCDIFSFGVVLVEIASRKLPFGSVRTKDIPKRLAKGLHQKVPAKTPRVFAWMANACWAMSLECRPQIEAVKQALGDIEEADLRRGAAPAQVGPRR